MRVPDLQGAELPGAVTSRLAGRGAHGDEAGGNDGSPDDSGGGWTATRQVAGVISPTARLRLAEHRCPPLRTLHSTLPLRSNMRPHKSQAAARCFCRQGQGDGAGTAGPRAVVVCAMPSSSRA